MTCMKRSLSASWWHPVLRTQQRQTFAGTSPALQHRNRLQVEPHQPLLLWFAARSELLKPQYYFSCTKKKKKNRVY